METCHRIRLCPGAERNLLSGHAWVYRNQLEDCPKSVQAGDLGDLHDSRGRFLGRAYLNPQSMIVARVLAREPVTIDQAFFLNRIREADALRQRLIPGRSVYRVIHSEGDRLPGLIVDRYDEAIVIQILTAGMERRQKMILDALDELFHPRLVIARNDSTMREHEGLARERLVLRGDSPTDITVLINGLKVSVDLWAGQKTGLFLDQMDNYHLAERIAAGARVLDCFCYLGIWGLHAAQAGASRVLGIDRSEAAIQQAQRIAKANGYEDRCNFQTGNVFDELRERDRRRELYDVIILDPPAFVKSRARLAEAIRGYKEINLRAMRLLRPGGFLITCSCSHYLQAEQFRALLLDAACDARRSPRLLAQQGQGPDHPIVLGMPETEYLKCFLLEL